MTSPQLSRRHMLAAVAAAAPALAAGAAGSAQTGPNSGSSTPAAAGSAQGRAALVTGSSRGIGAATARRLARDGYAVTVNCLVNRDLAAQVVRDIESAGGRAIWRQADVGDPRQVRRLFDAHTEAFGGLDVVVNNAGIMNLAPFAEMTDAQFDRMIDTNLKGGFYVLREGARRVRDGGRLVSLSSSITQLKTEAYGPYAATKSAQDMYSGALAKELKGRRISVNAIAPGLVNTTLFTDGKTQQQIQGFIDRTPHGRLAEPADIANVISALCSNDGYWIDGQVVFANGGVV